MTQNTGLKIDNRRKRILELLEQDGSVDVVNLTKLLNTSAVTIRNDLDELEQHDLLVRIHGGAIQRLTKHRIPFFEMSRIVNRPLKACIATAAARLIQDGDTIFLNSGTSSLLFALELKQKHNLNIVTNSIHVALALGDETTFRVKLLGGDINIQYLFVYGNDALEQLGKYRADKSILSVNGFNLDDSGLTTYHPEEASLDRLMMERSKEVIVIADATKYGHQGFYKISSFDSIQKLVTNDSIGEAAIKSIRDLGVEVIIC